MKMGKQLAVILAISMATFVANANETKNKPSRLEEVHITGKLSRYGATKSDIPILETARSVSVIDEDFFRDIGAFTVDDTVAYTSGVIGDSFGFSTRGDFVKVRGFDAAEYRDGQQVLFGFYNNTRSDVYFLEQVEVLKGPASVLYGKGTPGGIVNAISKLAGPEKDNEILLDLGSHSRAQLAVDLNFNLANNFYGRIVSLYRESDTQVDNVNDDAIGFMPSITYQNNSTSMTAMVEYIDRESDTSHQFLPLNATGCLSDQVTITPDSVCANANEREIDASTYLGHPEFNRYDSESTLFSILGSHAFSDAVEIESVIRYKDAEVKYNQAWIDFNGSGIPRIDADGNGARTFYLSDARSEQLAVDLRLRFDINTGPFEHELVFGLAYQDVETENDTTFGRSQDVINVHNIVNGPVPALFTSGEAATDSPANLFEDQGIYINNQISLGHWKFNLGVRYDDVESTQNNNPAQNDSEVSSSVGVLYAFENGFSPYVSYAESFEPVIGEDAVTDDQLKPREGKLTEIGLKYQPNTNNAYITFAYFDIEESNLPNPSSLRGVISSQQEGVGSSEGVELEGFIQFGDFDLKASLTVMDTESAEDVPFSSIPEELFSTWLNYTPQDGVLSGFKIGLGVRYVGGNESNNVDAEVKVETDGYTVADAVIAYNIESLNLSLNIRNLTDEDYYSTCLARGDCFPGEERSAVARVAYRF